PALSIVLPIKTSFTKTRPLVIKAALLPPSRPWPDRARCRQQAAWLNAIGLSLSGRHAKGTHPASLFVFVAMARPCRKTYVARMATALSRPPINGALTGV